MSPGEVLVEIWKRGGRVATSDGRLRWDAPKGAVTKELLAELASNKEGVIDILEHLEGDSPGFFIWQGGTPEKKLTNLPNPTMAPADRAYKEAVDEAIATRFQAGDAVPPSPGGHAAISLLDVINPTDPLHPAHRHYQEAIHEVGMLWDRLKAAGEQEPPWLDPAVEDRLDAEVQAAFDAGDPDEAIRRIETWRQAWMNLLAPQAPGEARMGPSPAVEAAARQMDAAHLFDLVHDPDIPAENRDAYWAEVHRRAQEMIDEAEGRRPPPNQAVRDMFARAGGYSRCHRHRHWRSTEGVLVCGICHPPAAAALVAEWIEPAITAEEGGASTR